MKNAVGLTGGIFSYQDQRGIAWKGRILVFSGT